MMSPGPLARNDSPQPEDHPALVFIENADGVGQKQDDQDDNCNHTVE